MVAGQLWEAQLGQNQFPVGGGRECGVYRACELAGPLPPVDRGQRLVIYSLPGQAAPGEQHMCQKPVGTGEI